MAQIKDHIKVNILAAKNINRADIIGSSDPYVVVHFGDYFVGKTYHIPNTLYPRWEDRSFNIDIPHSHDIHKLPPLRIEVFDMNNMRDDVFLGGVILDTSYTKTLLGFDTDASTEETSSTVASTGGPTWFDLLPSPHLTDL